MAAFCPISAGRINMSSLLLKVLKYLLRSSCLWLQKLRVKNFNLIAHMRAVRHFSKLFGNVFAIVEIFVFCFLVLC